MASTSNSQSSPANAADIADLPASFDIKASCSQHDFGALAGDELVDSAPILQQSQHSRLGGRIAVGVIGNAGGWQLVVSLQLPQQDGISLARLDFAHGLSAATDARVFRFGRSEAGFVNRESALFDDIPGNLEWQTQRRFQIKCPFSRQRAARTQLLQHAVEFVQAALHGAVEALFFQRDDVFDALGLLHQFAVMLAHVVDDGIRDFRQEGAVKAELAAKASRPPDDDAGNGRAAFGAGQDTVADEEDSRPRMIGDDAVGHDIGIAMGIAVPGQRLYAPNDGHEQIGFVVGFHALQHRNDTLQAQACVHARRWQRHIVQAAVLGIGLLAIELHEDQIPDFQEALFFGLQLGDDLVCRRAAAVCPSESRMWDHKDRYRPSARSWYRDPCGRPVWDQCPGRPPRRCRLRRHSHRRYRPVARAAIQRPGSAGYRHSESPRA